MFQKDKPRRIRSPLSGKIRSSGISLSLKGLVLVMCLGLGLIVYKIANGMANQHPSASTLNKAASSSTGSKNNQKSIKEDDALKQAQQEEMRQFQQDIKDGDMDLALDNEAAREEKREQEREKMAKLEEEKKWKSQGGVMRWDPSKTIPSWMKEYFVWHNEQTAKMTEENWRDFRYIVMTCLHDLQCGNVAHRLRPLPAMLRAAKDSNRILLIHWDAPQRLEHFMEPPHHGSINWIVPDYMMRAVRKVGHQTQMEVITEQASHVDRIMVNSMFNDDSFAEAYYNDKRKDGEMAADRVFHDVWNTMFKPTFMMQERISESLRLVGLKEGEYSSLHIDYEIVPTDEIEKRELQERVENALNCVSQLRPGGPYFVAAQTYDIARMAQLYGKQKGVVVRAKQITHDLATVPNDLFTSFVEVYFMANAKCAGYNRGGYGQLGYILGYDYDCRVKVGKPADKKCDWKGDGVANM